MVAAVSGAGLVGSLFLPWYYSPIVCVTGPCPSGTFGTGWSEHDRYAVALAAAAAFGLRPGMSRSGANHRPVEPNPPKPRAVSSSDGTSRSSGAASATSRSWAIRSPISTSNDSRRSVLSRSTRSSPR